MSKFEMPVPRLRVYLLRHGEVENHSEMRVNGQIDVGLSPRGEEQMRKAAEALCARPLSAVYSSDLYRARRGGELLAQKLGQGVKVVSALREMHFGEVEGMLWRDAIKTLGDTPEQWINWVDNRFPGGENLLDFHERVLPAYKKIINEESGEIAIFAHGGVNRMILCDALGIDLKNFFRLEQSYACLNIIDYYHPLTQVIKLINGNCAGLDNFL